MVRKFLVTWLAGLSVVSVSMAAEVSLRILETTDLHMNLLSYDYYQDKPTDQYGLSRTIALIKAARAETANSLLFDNGDLIQGSPMGELVAKVQPLKSGQVHPAYKVMNTLAYDAGNIGNHRLQVLFHLDHDLEVPAFDVDGVVDGRDAVRELDVHHGTDHLNDSTDVL